MLLNFLVNFYLLIPVWLIKLICIFNKDIKREKLSNMIKNNQPKRSLTAKSVREQFIQEVEDKKDKVDKVIDIMRGKNKIKINPEVKESVDKT